MSGHNKWTQIKRQKGKTDAAKSKTFAKFSALITLEVRKALGNKDAPAVRSVVERARAVNVPSENIERAIQRAAEVGNAGMESVTYEAYGPGGAALLIEVVTTNRNKAAQEVKHILSEVNSILASPGNVKWAFEKTATGWKPTTLISISTEDMAALEKLIDALKSSDEVQEVITNGN